MAPPPPAARPPRGICSVQKRDKGTELAQAGSEDFRTKHLRPRESPGSKGAACTKALLVKLNCAAQPSLLDGRASAALVLGMVPDGWAVLTDPVRDAPNLPGLERKHFVESIA